jgi:hypothetical protein
VTEEKESRPARRLPEVRIAPRIATARDSIRVTAEELAWIEANPERAARAVLSVDGAVDGFCKRRRL